MRNTQLRNGNPEFGKAAIVTGAGVGISEITARLFSDDVAYVPFNDTPADFCTGTCLLIGCGMAIQTAVFAYLLSERIRLQSTMQSDIE